MFPRSATLLLLLTATVFAQDPARLDQIVQSYVASDHFMGTVLVAKGDKVLLSKGYGSANLEWNVPNAPSTKFRLGSITKQFTAASILLLEERGKLKVDDPVKKYMPDAPPAWNKITIFNLLTHTSGIPNFTSFPDYATTEALPSPAEKTIARFAISHWISSRARSTATAIRVSFSWAIWSRRSAAKAMRNFFRKTSSRPSG